MATQISIPFTDILNTCIGNGQWPDLWKEEAVTPIPKVNPPNDMHDLRNISGLKNFNKISKKILAAMVLSDMKNYLVKSQFGNQKGVSIQHYVVKFMDKVLVSLDENSKGKIYAVIATFIDWKQAFSRQDPKLGIESFMKNGVSPSLVPALINYFQGGKRFVRWHGHKSKKRN